MDVLLTFPLWLYSAMHEKRKIKRVHLIYYLRLFDKQTNNQVGHLVDITTEGIMMISEEPIEIGKDFSFKMPFNEKSPKGGFWKGKIPLTYKAFSI